MKLLITGGSGLIGRHFIQTFNSQHQFTVLTRNVENAKKHLPENVELITTLPIENSFDIILNLAGEPIADKRWTTKQKEKICQSRWQVTEQLVAMVNNSPLKPQCFISGSAVGYYGNTGLNVATETSKVLHPDFAHAVCKKWENIALTLEKDCRVVLLRTGVVLANNGGALSKLLLPFSLGLGGKISHGHQFMSWIHIKDMVNIIDFAINNKIVHGAINCTSPRTISNVEFTKALGKKLHRPTLFAMPAFILKIIMGQSAELLITSQDAYPEKLLMSDFHFTYEDIGQALDNILK